ncbi:MAG: nuclear transport factor 2 family protein [Allomuricauda sp.]
MKNRTFIVLWGFLCFFLTNCDTVKKEEIKQGADPTMDKTEPKVEDVEEAVKIFNSAMVNPQREVLEELCSDQLTYGHSSGLIQNKEEFIDDLMNGPFDFSSVEALDQTVHLVGETAIVRHIFFAQATKEGEPIEIKLGNIEVFKRNEAGKWELLARQAYKL